jgi:hypothetical protein
MTCDCALIIAEIFEVSIATVFKIVRTFISAIAMSALHFIEWPDNEDLDLVKRKFERIRGISQVCGASDCIHVQMKLLGHTRSIDYFDKDKNYSYVV